MNDALIDSFSKWLKNTQVSAAITHSTWIWPASETLHFIGLALLVGTVGLADLRMLGMAKGLHFAGLHRLIRWGIFGFAINVVTGIIFFVGAPYQYVHNIVFQWKLVFLLLAGINALVFEYAVLPKAQLLGPGDDAPVSAKLIAAISLFLWLGVMFLGRMLPFIGDAF